MTRSEPMTLYKKPYFFQMFWKDRRSKKSYWNMIFLVLSGKMIFFPKIWFYSLDGNERWSFSKNTWKCDIFCVFGKDGISISYKYDITLLSKYYPSDLFWEKIHLKITFLLSLKKMIFILANMVFLLIEKGVCQNSCESSQNWGSYKKKETTYFKGAFFQFPPLI